MTNTNSLTEEDFVEVIRAIVTGEGPASVRHIHRRLGRNASEQKIKLAIRHLTKQSVIKDVYFNDYAYWIVNNARHFVDSDSHTIKAVTDSCKAQFATDSESIQVTRLSDRYQLTVWWDEENSNTKQSANYFLENPSLGYDSSQEETAIPESRPLLLRPFPNDNENVIGRMIDLAPRSSIENGITVVTVKSKSNGYTVSVYTMNNVKTSPTTEKEATFDETRQIA